MNDNFSYDVFLSHSSKDKSVVRDIAERLRKDGLKVWFDEWVIKPGDNIPAKIEEGLKHSRIMVLCMSANAFGADWAQLESGTFRFRDPLNKERRFIPLRLDNAEIEGSLAQFLYIKWQPDNRRQEYAKLLEACRPDAHLDQFYADCMQLLQHGMSERTLIAALLGEIESFSRTRPFDHRQFHWNIVKAISGIMQRKNYSLLTILKSNIHDCLSRSTSSAEDLNQCISDFRDLLSSTLEALAANGAKNIESGDTILLYAHSQSVHAALNKWLQENPTGALKLYFCQCVGKPTQKGQPFKNALSSANQICRHNARIFFVPDSAVGQLLTSATIKKVFFGAHQWGWLPGRKAWFTNTQGTLAIAATATLSGIPIFVLAETQKTNSALSPLNNATTNKRHVVENRPTETEKSLPVEYVEIVADEIDSGLIPFVLVTEQGEFACADSDLRKRNRVIIDPDGHKASKRTTDRLTANSEKAVLELFGRTTTQQTHGFQVPVLLSHTASWASVSMQRKAGIRMHDLIATLNSVASKRDGDFRAKADNFRKKACEWAIKDVLTWQSEKFQTRLQGSFGANQGPYPFESKLNAAIAYVSNCPATSNHLKPAILEQAAAFASNLTRRATTFLRDATLKNQILELGPLLGSDLPNRCRAMEYFPLVNDQWFDPGIAELLMDRIPHETFWQQVRSNLWHVDFELASCLTTREDDLIHVLALEIFSKSYDEIVNAVNDHLPETEEQHIHEIMLFRCFRAWVRRLFYHREEPKTFATRYRHETLAYYHGLAQTAVQRLGACLGDDLTDFIKSTRPTM
jgi:translation initiation factor 2B subunit (eIF-2B alpha/beta/delta family)